ncbi:DUF3427 domain-containing protein [Planctomicrobium sp. SH668]|uniref:DUF3427 domain-containing protein n=1 Tax=Planctomicrobium sp. SH668 TaxID=3448126 RepID=UPI003F5C0E8F
MVVSFDGVVIGNDYSRKTLAKLWGYSSYHALARGVVTPEADNKIILFVTKEKQASSEQYADSLNGNFLFWEGPNDHFAEGRMVNATQSDDEIHLFYRPRHHSEFTYLGELSVLEFKEYKDQPSQFVFKLESYK